MSDIELIEPVAVPAIGQTRRRRLPHRREAITESIEFARSGGQVTRYEASVGYDELGRPKEIFLSGAKDGTDMAAVLADASVAISVALQHGVSAAAMAVSIARIAPSDGAMGPGLPASVIGAALDLLVRCETEAT